MPKQKSSAEIHIADGEDGMRAVVDLRFEAGEWPIEFVVPKKDADSWMAHLRSEIEERGWNSGGLSQLEAAENSGTLSVYTANGPNPPTLHIVWERRRGAALRVKAHPDGNPTLSLDLAREFINAANQRMQRNVTVRAHRWDLLTYRGLSWRGELWLGDDLRLGPPSRFPDALSGPQVIIVDAMVEGIGSEGIMDNFETRIRELKIFLGIVLGICPRSVRPKLDWVAEFDDQGCPTACELRSVGYWEVGPHRTFPIKGSCSPVARELVLRPGVGRIGIHSDMRERWVPADIEELWRAFTALPVAKRDNILRAGNAYLTADSMWPDQRTAYAVFLVIACETLKPKGKRYDRMNIYGVVASLIGLNEALRLRDLSIHPQQVRSRHMHRGELASGEFLPSLVNNDFADPSFDEMLRELWKTCRLCLIEWLRCGGEYKVVSLPRPPRSKRSVRQVQLGSKIRGAMKWSPPQTGATKASR
ncbi:MAG: hypothetical protein H7X91_09540 [Burkholderiales bacterium]|nr:hypothetical protein [Burkholderiales bacterium]